MVAMMQDDYAGTLTPDAKLRTKLFGDEVMRHPAKQSIPQLIHLLDRFAVAGGVLLDPFGGSGCAMLACAPSYGGMYVITVELARHFYAMQQRAWEHFSHSIDMMDVYDVPPGDYWPMLGDSRDLVSLIERETADLIISSPSYGGSEAVDQRKKQNGTIAAHGGGNTVKANYTICMGKASHEQGYKHIGGHCGGKLRRDGYIDTIITSPPYQDSLTDGNPKRKPEQVFKVLDKQAKSRIMPAYGIGLENIGNLRGDKYLASMAQVWAGCAAVLKPGGILCCITRDCVRDGKIVPVGQQNRDLLTAAGLTLIDIEAWKVDRLSFWRILQARKNPNAPIISTEEVSIFQKPERPL